MNGLMDKVRLALRITTDAFDSEISDLISAAQLDLAVAGVTEATTSNSLWIRAIVTYCKMNFGDIDTAEYDRLKASYDEQKAQMGMATGYTDWLTNEAE